MNKTKIKNKKLFSFSLRIRHYLETHKLLQAVLKIVVDEIRKTLICLTQDDIAGTQECIQKRVLKYFY
ncbi:MAG: hypothetical protein JSR37_01585 [Verrucomicrobia bacterium]|nr:hypothetical protein [Verrucomicrobiota bacterium]MBS0637754.1 hypothetical protein [Verrucomicrobiota bacterium]